MNYILVVGYVVIAIAFVIWQEAMDRRYGVEPEASTSALSTLAIAVVWPIGVPLSMAAVANGGWGRWTRLKP